MESLARDDDDSLLSHLCSSSDVASLSFNACPPSSGVEGRCLDSLLSGLMSGIEELSSTCSRVMDLLDRASLPFRLVVEGGDAGDAGDGTSSTSDSWGVFSSIRSAMAKPRAFTQSQALEVYSLLEHIRGSIERISSGLVLFSSLELPSALGLRSVGGLRSLVLLLSQVLGVLERRLSWFDARKTSRGVCSPFCARMRSLSSQLGQLATISTVAQCLCTPHSRRPTTVDSRIDDDDDGGGGGGGGGGLDEPSRDGRSLMFVPFDHLESSCPVEFNLWYSTRYKYHLGYEFDRSLLDFSHQIAMFYAASLRANGQSNDLLKRAAFSTFATRYLLSPDASKRAALKLTANITLDELVMVWSVMEDDTIRFMAVNSGYFAHHVVDVDTPFVIGWKPLEYGVTPACPSGDASLDLQGSLRDGPRSGVFLTDRAERKIRLRLIWHTKNNEDARSQELSSHHAASATTPSAQRPSPRRSRMAFSMPSLPPAVTRPASMALSALWPDSNEIDGLRKRPHLIFHVHGGGFISQTSVTHNVYLHWWAHMTNIPIVTVDYTLAPIERYPYALYECFESYRWVLKNHASLGIAVDTDDPLRVVLVGDSAGGNLVLGVIQLAIRHDVPLPVGLLLNYPATELSRTASFSRVVFGNDPVLNRLATEHCMKAYLGEDTEEVALLDPLVSPSLAPLDVLAQFPKTFILVGSIDPLLDDSVHMAEQFRLAGVDVTLRVYDGLPHGFLNLSKTIPSCRNAIVDAYIILQHLLLNG